MIDGYFIDGGGILGLPSLYILKEAMKIVSPDKPWPVFDMTRARPLISSELDVSPAVFYYLGNFLWDFVNLEPMLGVRNRAASCD